MKSTTTVYYVSDGDDRPEPVECVSPGYPNLDERGRTMYDNSHFRTEQEAWEWLIRDVDAMSSLVARDFIGARAKVVSLNEDAADVVIDGKTTWEDNR